MKLIMTTSLSGPDTDILVGPHETDDVEGQRLIDAGFAELAPEELAAAQPAEGSQA